MPDRKAASEVASLAESAKGYANELLRKRGWLFPAVLALTPNNHCVLVTGTVMSGTPDASFFNAARLLAIGYKAKALAMVQWSRAAPLKCPLATASGPDGETVSIMAASRSGYALRQTLAVKRDDIGVYRGLGRPTHLAGRVAAARLCMLLPANEPSDVLAAKARRMLTPEEWILVRNN